MLLPLLAFVFGTALIGAATFALMPNKAAAIDRRLEELTLRGEADEERVPRLQALVAMFKRIGDRMPQSPKEMGSLKLRLVQAGYRRAEALPIFFGIRVAFAFGLFLFFSTGIVAKLERRQ